MNAAQHPSRLSLWSRFLDSASRALVRLLWVVVVLVILAGVGKYLWMRYQEDEPRLVRTERTIARPAVAWNAVDQAVVDALERSREAARDLASERLDAWVADLMRRVDEDFLPWYFGYWNQQLLGLTGVYQQALHWVDGDAQDAAERVTEEVQEAFSERVLRPRIAQLELEGMLRDVVNRYVDTLRLELSAIPEKYAIPQGEWQRYLSDLAMVTTDTEGNREVDLSLKALTVGSTAAGALVLGKTLSAASGKLGGQLTGKLAGKTVAKMAAKSGAKVAASTSGKLLGPVVAVGIIVWDLWDHKATREEAEPVLRQNIADYLQQMRAVLLDDSESGLMATLYRLEASVLESLEARGEGGVSARTDAGG
jgi:hypothetical protein